MDDDDDEDDDLKSPVVVLKNTEVDVTDHIYLVRFTLSLLCHSVRTVRHNARSFVQL